MVRLIGTDRVATSSADGRYSLAISSPGTYKLQVNYIGFVPSAYQIVLGEQHTTAEVDFPLKQASVQLPEIVVPSAMGSALRARGLRQTGRPIINLSYRDAAPSEIYADSVGAARVTSTHLELQDQAGVVWRNVMPGNALVRMSLRRLDGRGAAGSWLGSTADYHGIQLHEDSITLRRYHGQPRTYNRIAAAPYSHRDAAIDLEILVLGDSLLAWAGDRHLFTAGGIRIPSGSALGILTLCCGQWAFNDIWLEELEAVPPSR